LFLRLAEEAAGDKAAAEVVAGDKTAEAVAAEGAAMATP